ncbi:MAG: polyhydroxyalkanoate synthesis regulator [Candidatus Omnitrophica bacterium]|nr:polyhydroxyalkanoate synthesis regulator [Candidatus Omnitrophota bacterium]
MRDFLEKAMNLGLGALVVTREKVEAVVDELVKKGEVGQEEGDKLVKELVDKGKEGKEEIEAQIEKMIKAIFEKLDLPTRKEFNELKSEIENLKEK